MLIEVFERMNKTGNGNDIHSHQLEFNSKAVVKRIKDNGYDHIIALPIATGLSSTLNGMKLACDMAQVPVTFD